MDIPDRIYLLIKDEDGEEPDEVMWCVDRIYDTDLEYVLAIRNKNGGTCKPVETR